MWCGVSTQAVLQRARAGPATGSAFQTISRIVGSFHIFTSSVLSSRAVTRSSRDSPEPSAMRTPGNRHAREPRIAARDGGAAGVVPRPSAWSPIAFSTISAAKLSLQWSIDSTISERGSE